MELDDDRPAGLDEAFADRQPDAAAEDEVVALLRAEGLLGGARPTLRSRGVRAAAAVALFAGGWVSATVATRSAESSARGLGAAAESAGAAGGSHVLLIWEGPDYVEEATPGERATEYAAWAASVARQGVPISGEELGPQRRMLAPTSAPPAGDPTRVSGYFVVTADSARALELASGHPHRAYGGWVEVAPIVPR